MPFVREAAVRCDVFVCSKIWRALPLVLGLFLLTCTALAQAPNVDAKGTARQWAIKGTEQYEAGDYQGAVTSFRNAESLFHAVTHLLYLARASEKMGRLADAREFYITLQHEEVPANASAGFREAKRIGEAELAALEPRVPYLTLTVEGGSNQPLAVTDNGQSLNAAALGIRRPVNPGEHRLIADGEGVHAEETVVLAEGEQKSATLRLQAVAKAPVAVAPAAPPPSPQAPAEQDQSKGRPLLYTGIGVGVLGVAGLVTGGFLLSSAADKRDQRDQTGSDCQTVDGELWCSADQADRISGLQNEEQSARTGAGWTMAIGTVALAAGGTMVVLDLVQHRTKTAAGRPITPWVGYRVAGVSGKF